LGAVVGATFRGLRGLISSGVGVFFLVDSGVGAFF